MTLGIDSSLLLNLYQARSALAGVSSGGASGILGTTAATKQYAPTAPWSNPPPAAQASAAVSSALAGKRFIDENTAQLDMAGASSDYRKLFALYQGLSTLEDVASHINQPHMTDAQKAQVTATFSRGLSEISSYVSDASLEKLRLTQGGVDESVSASLKTPRAGSTYTTPPLINSSTDEVPAFRGNVQFNISIKRVNTTVDVPIDLSNMGAQPRTIGNVVNYINSQLEASGFSTRFASIRQPGQPQTIVSGGKTITLKAASDQWAMTVTAGTSETVTFQPAATANAVYLAQSIGDPNPDKDPSTKDSRVQQQLLKFQTDTANVASPLQLSGQANFVDGRVFADTLGNNVGTVHATQVGPDGSVYMLADITGLTNGQTIRGTQDVALMKYDSAGKLLYTRTLGATNSATGLGLAVSSTGQVAITGSVSGSLSGAANGALNSGVTGAYAGQSDSFVTLYSAAGNELWTERRGAKQQDEGDQVAFSADGSMLYVAGRSQTALPSAGVASGGYDGYIESFTTAVNAATGAPTVTSTQMTGSAGADKPAGMVVSNNALYTASVESGRAVLRQYDISGGAPVLTATRDLGDLQNGTLAGLAIDGTDVVLAGGTANATFSGAPVTRAASGGVDAFAMKVSGDLTSTAGDAIAFYGGAGDDKATAVAVSNGQVFIAGAAGADLPGQAPVGTNDGFLAALDIGTGAIGWSRRFTGKDGRAAPTSIAVSSTGASILDRLGLPSGVLDLSASNQISAASSLRKGDSFTVQANGLPPKTITIDVGETLDTLATKIQRASSQQVKVTLLNLSGTRRLSIAPATGSAVITFGAGKPGADALEQLGIPQGVLRRTMTLGDKTVPADGGAPIFGLKLASTLNLSSAEQITHARAVVSQAMGVVRTAYQSLVTAATPQAVLDARAKAAAAPKGALPAYLTAQIANYQAGLNRLIGSGS